MSWLASYLVVGLTFYTVVAIARRHTFEGATAWPITKGVLFGVLGWPVMLPIMIYWKIKRIDP